MVIITAKKNRVSYGGKTFHVTPAGKHYPLGAKQNKFTRCMSDGLTGNMITGVDLSREQLQANRDKFKQVLGTCKTKKAPRGVGRPRKE